MTVFDRSTPSLLPIASLCIFVIFCAGCGDLTQTPVTECVAIAPEPDCTAEEEGQFISSTDWSECPVYGGVCGAYSARVNRVCRSGWYTHELEEIPCEDSGDTEAVNVHMGSLFIGSAEELGLASELQVVTGDLNIGGSYTSNVGDIQELLPLSNLTCVGGTVRLLSNPGISDLRGLDQLGYARDLLITNNGSLTSLNGLNSLDYIRGALFLYGQSFWVGEEELDTANPELNNLSGLDNLRLLRDGLYIVGSESLVNLHGIEQVDHIFGSVDVSGNPNLLNFNGLNNLRYIGGELSLKDNPLITEIDGLDSLEEIGFGLNLTDNPLVSLSGLSPLERLSGGRIVVSGTEGVLNLCALADISSDNDLGLRFENNASLSSLDGVPELATASHVVIANNPNLTRINSLGTIRSIALDMADDMVMAFSTKHLFMPEPAILSITENPNLENLTGLDGIHDVNETLTIANNASLTNLDALSALVEVGGQVTLSNLPSLTDVYGLNLLSSAGGIQLDQLDQITTLEGLESLESLPLASGDSTLSPYSGWLFLQNIPELASLSALSQLNEIDQTLHITGLDSLQNLDGLEGITTLTNLALSDNSLLEDISGGLGSLVEVGTVSICLNTQLPQCHIDQFIEQLVIEGEVSTSCGNDVTASCP